MSACSTSQPTVLLDSRLVCISRVWVGFVSGFTAVARVLLDGHGGREGQDWADV